MSRRAEAAALLSAAALALCGCGVVDDVAGAGKHVGNSALNTFLELLTPGLGVPCASRQGERGFTEGEAKACLLRVGGNYARGVRNGLAGR